MTLLGNLSRQVKLNSTSPLVHRRKMQMNQEETGIVPFLGPRRCDLRSLCAFPLSVLPLHLFEHVRSRHQDRFPTESFITVVCRLGISLHFRHIKSDKLSSSS